jgi:hypothetical protein
MPTPNDTQDPIGRLDLPPHRLRTLLGFYDAYSLQVGIFILVENMWEMTLMYGSSFFQLASGIFRPHHRDFRFTFIRRHSALKLIVLRSILLISCFPKVWHLPLPVQ